MNSMFDQNPVGGRSTENACLVSFCSCRRPLLHVFSIATWLHMWNRHIVHRNWNGPLDLCSRNMWSWVYILQTNRFADTLLFHVGNIWYILMLHLAQGFQDWTWTNNTGNLNTSSVHTSLLKPDSLRLNSSRCQQPWWLNERNIQLGSLDWCSQNLHSWTASLMLAPRAALFSCNQLYIYICVLEPMTLGVSEHWQKKWCWMVYILNMYSQKLCGLEEIVKDSSFILSLNKNIRLPADLRLIFFIVQSCLIHQRGQQFIANKCKWG